MDKDRVYLAIDLKSFYASVECVDRGLDPMTTNLVVADMSRTEKTICLAVSPSLKAHQISGRARMFEVVQQVKEVNQQRLAQAIRLGTALYADGQHTFRGSSFQAEALAADPSLELTYIIAPPRMAKYIEISSQIYSIYLNYIAPEDIHPYSIDEVFLDVTNYLSTYHLSPYELARTMIRDVLHQTGITATAGIGTNLYLAKIAMDIMAKHIPANEDGSRIAALDELSFREQLWDHTPLTDFWRIGKGTARRLERLNIFTMGQLAKFSLSGEDRLYREFGIDAEILIDHAWGIEPCRMEDIKQYRPSSSSICEGQVLSEPYSFENAQIIVREMTDTLITQLVSKGLATDSITLDISYDRASLSDGSYAGIILEDHYGRPVPKPAHGSARLDHPTSLTSKLMPAFLQLYTRITDPKLLVRKITLTAQRVVQDDGLLQCSLFEDPAKLEKEKKLQAAVVGLKQKYGKNALLKGTNLQKYATMRDRNRQIGGHKA